MAAPAAFAPIAKQAAKRALVRLASSALTPKGGEGSSSRGPLAVIGTVLVLLVLPIVLLVSAPMALWGIAAEGEADLGRLDGLASGHMVRWYEDKAYELEEWARSRWSSGTGEDVYSTPDWRYLCALDTAVSENDFDLVKANEDYYDGIHRTALMARASVKYRYAEAGQDDEGSVYSELDGKWYVMEPYTVWTVSYRGLRSLFESGSGILTDEFRYFAQHESGDYGGVWGDMGNALGYYQFDRRYALPPFIDWLLAQDTAKWSMFEPWRGSGTIARGDSALEAAWQRAYEADPVAFSAAQDRYEYETVYVPGAEWLLANRGVDMSDRRDAVKGLVCGMRNLFGSGGWQPLTAGIDDSMSDEELARTLCGNVMAARPSYAPRYQAELEEVLFLLSQPAQAADGAEAIFVGADPSAEGGNLPLSIKAELAANYRRALGAVRVAGGAVTFDQASFIAAITGSLSGGEGFADVVNAAMSRLGCPYVWGAEGPDAFDCSGLVMWCYAQAGINLPHYTGDQIRACERIDESEAAPGDLVFLRFDSAGVPQHVGIYIGNGQMIHAPNSRSVVRIDDVRMSYQNPVFAKVSCSP